MVADEDAREAQVIVPDYQLSLAIGKEGQNARLAAKLTGYKIDIKSETQARELGLFEEMGLDGGMEEGSFEGYEDGYEDGYPEESQADYEAGYLQEGQADYEGGYPQESQADYEGGYPQEGQPDYEGDYPQAAQEGGYEEHQEDVSEDYQKGYEDYQ